MKEQIKNFIEKNFIFGEKKLEDNELLFDSGIIDSIGFIELLAFIEKTFNISLDMSEITIEKFNTINNIVETIKDKIDR